MTTETQLSRMAEKLKIHDFRGIRYIRNVKSFSKEGNYILQMKAPTKIERGVLLTKHGLQIQTIPSDDPAHWVAFMNKDGKYWYFDPFGFPPPEAIKKHFRDVVYNKNQYQKLYNECCGEYCIMFLFYFSKKGWDGAIKVFNENYSHNSEKLINQLYGMLGANTSFHLVHDS